MKDVIIVKGLTKNFNSLRAVDEVSFTVKEGEVFGFLGPNGAGKTTTINMLSTLMYPSTGSATVNGYDVYKERDEIRRSIGIVFQDPALDNRLTGYENLMFHSMLYDLSKNEMDKRIKEVLKLVDLTDKAGVLVNNYSGGMKRRLEIARGLIHKPRVLFLDEPTLGLDPQTRRKIWDYIKQLNKKEGTSIMLTTHYMEEADFLCDRVAIIDKGKIIAKGTPATLKNLVGGDVIRLEFKQGGSKLEKECLKVKWISKVKRYDDGLTLTVKKAETKIPRILELANNCGAKVNSINLSKPSLEDVFLHYTGRGIREHEATRHEQFRARAMRRMRRHG